MLIYLSSIQARPCGLAFFVCFPGNECIADIRYRPVNRTISPYTRLR